MKDSRYYLRIFDEIDLEITHIKDLFQGEESFVLGLRPNDLRLNDRGKNGLTSFLPTAMLSEVIGSETIVYLKHNSSELRMLVSELVHYERQKIKVFFDPCNIYIFGKKSGELITKYSKE